FPGPLLSRQFAYRRISPQTGQHIRQIWSNLPVSTGLSAQNFASHAALSKHLDAKGAQHAGEPVERKAHHIEITTLDTLHQDGAVPLNAVGAGFVHGLSCRDVPGNLVVAEGPKGDVGRFV